jgi:hypothetical protein
VPKTLAEIAIEAGLVTKADAQKAGKMAEERKEPLVVMLVREIGVDEVALVGAIRKATRVPLIDPAEIQIDPEALRHVERDACFRLRVMPLGITAEGDVKILRLAMADPTDTSGILEIQSLTQYEIDVSVLPLSAIEELLKKGYRQLTTAVVTRPTGHTSFITQKGKIASAADIPESEVSVTAQIPLAALHAFGGSPDDLEARFMSLVHLLVAKGVITEAEGEALRKVKPSS